MSILNSTINNYQNGMTMAMFRCILEHSIQPFQTFAFYLDQWVSWVTIRLYLWSVRTIRLLTRFWLFIRMSDTNAYQCSPEYVWPKGRMCSSKRKRGSGTYNRMETAHCKLTLGTTKLLQLVPARNQRRITNRRLARNMYRILF